MMIGFNKGNYRSEYSTAEQSLPLASITQGELSCEVAKNHPTEDEIKAAAKKSWNTYFNSLLNSSLNLEKMEGDVEGEAATRIQRAYRLYKIARGKAEPNAKSIKSIRLKGLSEDEIIKTLKDLNITSFSFLGLKDLIAIFSLLTTHLESLFNQLPFEKFEKLISVVFNGIYKEHVGILRIDEMDDILISLPRLALSKEQKLSLANLQAQRFGLNSLDNWKFDSETLSSLKNQVRDKLISILPRFSVELVQEVISKKDRTALQDLAYRLFSGKYFELKALCDTRHDLSLSLQDSSSSIESIGDLLIKARKDQEKSLLDTGFSYLNKPHFTRSLPNSNVSWGDKFQENNPSKKIEVSHGGGLRHILSFIKGTSLGYFEDGQQMQGIYLSPENCSRDRYYAERSSIMHMDTPAILTARIAANKIQSVRNGYEAFLPYQDFFHLEDIRITVIKK